ncbi:inorganic diphosphatase [[Mycoplasma] testudinis]|uniref:inorganic diphosphatase n=1 Tax=[Mycoplasma] testudinis TaxID=33924 RepID=UPI0004858DFA|nr:inorganic diphosphatase [[Mycoplasma] testudinis]
MAKNIELNITIEIPKNSNVKYEYDRKTNQISVDRILYGSDHYPQNYGFIKEALDWDGDELDCLVVSDQPFMPGVSVPTRIIGAMGMIDSGETDTKLIGVIACDPRYNHINDLKDLSPHLLAEIKTFFETYKILQKKSVVITGFKDVNWAINEYQECVKLMNEYGSMDKDKFIKKMKKEHPEKYRVPKQK